MHLDGSVNWSNHSLFVDGCLIEQLLNSLLEGAVNFPDSAVQRLCFQVLTKFVELYGEHLDAFIKNFTFFLP